MIIMRKSYIHGSAQLLACYCSRDWLSVASLGTCSSRVAHVMIPHALVRKFHKPLVLCSFQLERNEIVTE